MSRHELLIGERYRQVRRGAPILAADGEKLGCAVDRWPDTLGGGTVVDAVAERHGRAQAHRERLASGTGASGGTTSFRH
jgi:hypothetical protein